MTKEQRIDPIPALKRQLGALLTVTLGTEQRRFCYHSTRDEPRTRD